MKFEARIQELVENIADSRRWWNPLLTLREQIVILHRRLLAIVRDNEVYGASMTTPDNSG